MEDLSSNLNAWPGKCHLYVLKKGEIKTCFIAVSKEIIYLLNQTNYIIYLFSEL